MESLEITVFVGYNLLIRSIFCTVQRNWCASSSMGGSKVEKGHIREAGIWRRRKDKRQKDSDKAKQLQSKDKTINRHVFPVSRDVETAMWRVHRIF